MISDLEERLRGVTKQINNLVKAVAETGNVSLAAGLEELESRKGELHRQIASASAANEVEDIPIEQLKRAIQAAGEALRSGSLPEIRQVINLYLKRVTVYREHIEVELSMLPAFVTSPINQYIDKNEEKTNQPPQYNVVVDSVGGGGGNRTPVRKHIHRNFSGRRQSFRFPYSGVDCHTRELGSFIIHGALKALHTHVHH